MKSPKAVAVEAARAAGKQILAMSEKGVGYTKKNARDILSEADLASEKIIIQTIKQYYPDHNILSEEAGEEDNASEHRWIIDPIDGTINFAKHVEEFAISIAYSVGNEVLIGLVYQPALRKLYVAEKGKGATLNGKPIHVSQDTELIDCLIATDNTSNKEKQTKIFTILTALSTEFRHVRIFGSMALHLARIAEGQFDVYFKTKLNYWDVAAGLLLIREAGGTVTELDGNEFAHNSKTILATNGKVHKKALSLITKFL